MTQENLYSPRKIPTQARSKATFEAVLDAAARVLTEEGYDSASTNRIAEVAGVSIGSLYEYFPGKEAIFSALNQRFLEQQYVMFSEALANAEGLLPQELMTILIHKTIEAVLLNTPLNVALLNELPYHVIRQQNTASFDRLFEVSLLFLRQSKADLRKEKLETAIWIALRVPALVIGNAAVTDIDRLKNEEFANELIDMQVRFWLKGVD